MTKNQRIKRLEETVKIMGKLLGLNIYFPCYKCRTSENISWNTWDPPIKGWADLRMKALLKHLGIVDFCEKEQPPKEYEVITKK